MSSPETFQLAHGFEYLILINVRVDFEYYEFLIKIIFNIDKKYISNKTYIYQNKSVWITSCKQKFKKKKRSLLLTLMTETNYTRDTLWNRFRAVHPLNLS